MSEERPREKVSRRDMFGRLGLSRIRERFDEEMPDALAAQAQEAGARSSEPAWGAWDVSPPEGSEKFTRAAAARLVDACGVKEGERVLDWGCGQGEVALAAARLGAHVTAVDLAPAPLERGWDLAEADGLEVDWLEQDGLDLMLGNAWFDRSLSGFGVIWSRDMPAAVRELFRVTRPGGAVGFTTWSNRGFYGEFLRVVRERDLLPPGPSPSAWGWDQGLRQDFQPLAATLEVQTRELDLQIEDDDALWDFVAQSAAPAARRLADMPGADREDVEDEVRALVVDSGATPARYLEVVAEVPAV